MSTKVFQNCPHCGGALSYELKYHGTDAYCPEQGCGQIIRLCGQLNEAQKQELLRLVARTAAEMHMANFRPKCPLCGGTLSRMDAGERGSAFAQGNLLGAFARTHRCTNCGHMV
jgi:uncharacterized protein with PIN domain